MPTTVVLVNGQHDNHIYIYILCILLYIYSVILYIYTVYMVLMPNISQQSLPGWYLSRGLESSDPSTGIIVGSTGRLGVYPQNLPKE